MVAVRGRALESHRDWVVTFLGNDPSRYFSLVEAKVRCAAIL